MAQYPSRLIDGAFIVAGGDRAELFESGEEVLDQMPRLVEIFIVCAGDLPVGFWRDDDGCARLLQWVDTRSSASKALSAMTVSASMLGSGASAPSCLSRREMEACGIAQCIGRWHRFLWSAHRCCARWLPAPDAPFCTSAVLVGADDCRINHGGFVIRVIGETLEHLLPHAAFAPARMAGMDDTKIHEPLW